MSVTLDSARPTGARPWPGPRALRTLIVIRWVAIIGQAITLRW
jgi:hypothetical protein